MNTKDCNTAQGVITKIEGKKITVYISQNEACSSCAAATMCEKTSSRGKTLVVEQDNANIFSVAETVNVNTPQNKTLKAIRLAFLYPVLLMAMVVVVKYFVDFSDNLLALLCLFVVALYYFVMYLFRNSKLFNFGIFISKQ